MLGSFGHPVPVPWSPTVTVEAAPSSYSPKLFLALGPGGQDRLFPLLDDTVHSQSATSCLPSCTGSEPPELDSTLGSFLGTCCSLASLEGSTGLRVKRWSSRHTVFPLLDPGHVLFHASDVFCLLPPELPPELPVDPCFSCPSYPLPGLWTQFFLSQGPVVCPTQKTVATCIQVSAWLLAP